MRKILPSLHVLEAFMPVTGDEDFFVKEILPRVAEIPFYKGIELPLIFRQANQNAVRCLVERNRYQLTQWASPNIAASGLMLSSTDRARRKAAVAYTVELIKSAAQCGVTNVGLPSGDDPGDSNGDRLRNEAKKALFESFCEVADAASSFAGLHLIYEPLDRYAHKKQLLGPIHEVMEWFAGLKRVCSNFYIHWDSAHEALAGIELLESLQAALPYMAQFHICNCVTIPGHPYYGDYHIAVGRAPKFKNWGYLTPEVAAPMLMCTSEADTVPGVENTYWALEVRAHMGDDLWEREKEIREFMQRTYELAKLEPDIETTIDVRK